MSTVTPAVATGPRTAPAPHPPQDVAARAAVVLARAEAADDRFAELFRDLHAHPELSFQEERTAARLAAELTASGLDVTTGVGRTGVVGVLHNGPGPVVLIRGDMDALPVTEETGLPYASTVRGRTPEGEETGVMHACGHDMHTATVAAVADALAAARDQWSGTLLVVGQPAEEVIGGARAMVADGLFERFGVPDVVLGQHVGGLPVGRVMHRAGPIMTATTTVVVTVHGRGGHGSHPSAAVDPVLTAAQVVARLQVLVARESTADAPCVVTVGKLTAGTKANIIPDTAELQITVRAPSTARLVELVDRIREVALAEGRAGGCPRPPTVDVAPLGAATVNDAAVHAAVDAAQRAVLGDAQVWHQRQLVMASEDFGVLGGGDVLPEPVPTMFWFVGAFDPALWGDDAGPDTPPPAGLPGGHTSTFAPLPTTLTAGRAAMVAAVLTYL